MAGYAQQRDAIQDAEDRELFRQLLNRSVGEPLETKTEKEVSKQMAATVVSPREVRNIHIEGDLAVIKRTIVEREVKTSDLVDELCKGRPLDTGPLPVGCVTYCRYSERDSGAIMSLYVIQIGPHMRKAIHKRPANTADEERHPERCISELMLSWPNTLWFVRFKNSSLLDVHLCSTLDPLSKNAYATVMYLMPMPNQYDLGHKNFCTGNITVDMGLPFATRVEQVMTQLLESMWNEELPADFRSVGIVNLRDWHEKSALDPQFYKKLALRPHPRGDVKKMLHFLGMQAQ